MPEPGKRCTNEEQGLHVVLPGTPPADPAASPRSSMMRTTVRPGASRRRRLALGSVSIVAGLALAACGGGVTPEEAAQGGGGAEAPEFTGEYDGPDVELAYWNGFTGGDGPFMQKMV